MNSDEKQISSVFSHLLGVTPKLKYTETAITNNSEEKDLFASAIEEWGIAWRQQGTLFTKYGLDLSGYDNLLYSSIESLIILMFGPVKAQVIGAYVYNKTNTEEDLLKVRDIHGNNHYIRDINELYEFIHTIKDEDLLMDDDDENDNDEN